MSRFLPFFLFTFSLSLVANPEPVKEVIISGNDAMQFDIKNFQAKPGESIRLTLKNIGSIPKIAMGHNWVLLKKGADAISFGQKVLASGGSATNPLP